MFYELADWTTGSDGSVDELTSSGVFIHHVKKRGICIRCGVMV